MQISAIIAEVLRIPVTDVTEHMSMESSPLWDSLSHMEIVYALEKTFAIELSGDEIIQVTSVNKIREIISQKMGESLEA